MDIQHLVKLAFDGSPAIAGIQRSSQAMSTAQQRARDLRRAVSAGATALAGLAAAIGSSQEAAVASIAQATGAQGAALDALRADYAETLRSAVGLRRGTEDTAEAIGTVNTALGLTGPALQRVAGQMVDAGVDTAAFLALTRGLGVGAADAGRALDLLTTLSQQHGVEVSDIVKRTARYRTELEDLGLEWDAQLVVVAQATAAGGRLRETIRDMEDGSGTWRAELAQAVTDLGEYEGATDRASEASATWRDRIGTISDRLGAWVADLGPGAVTAIGSVATAVGTITTALPLMGTAATAAWALVTGPIGLIALAIAGLSTVVYTWRDDIGAALATALTHVQTWVTNVTIPLRAFASVIPGEIGGKITGALDTVDTAIEKTKGWLNALGDDAEDTVSPQMTAALGDVQSAVADVGTAATTAGAAVTAAVTTTKPKIESLGTAATTAGAATSAAVTTAVTTAKPEIESLGTMGVTSAQALTTAWKLPQVVPQLDGVTATAKPKIESLGTMGVTSAQALTTAWKLPQVVPQVQGMVAAVDAELTSAPATWTSTLSAEIGRLWTPDHVGGLLASAFVGGGGLTGAVQALGSQVGGALSTSIQTAVADRLTGGLRGVLGSAISGLLPGLGGLVGGVAGKLVGWITGAFKRPSAAEQGAREMAATMAATLSDSATREQIEEAQHWIADGWTRVDAQAIVALRGRFLEAGRTAEEANAAWERRDEAVRAGNQELVQSIHADWDSLVSAAGPAAAAAQEWGVSADTALRALDVDAAERFRAGMTAAAEAVRETHAVMQPLVEVVRATYVAWGGLRERLAGPAADALRDAGAVVVQATTALRALAAAADAVPRRVAIEVSVAGADEARALLADLRAGTGEVSDALAEAVLSRRVDLEDRHRRVQ